MKNLEKYLSVLDGEVDGLLLTSRYSRHYGAEFDIAEGIAIVMVTHDIQNALQYATTIPHAGHGQWFCGTTAEYLASPWGKRFGGEGK